MNKIMEQLLSIEYGSFYENYIEKASNYNSILEGLEETKNDLISFYKNLPETKLMYQYDVDKWTPKDILLHLIDSERIFTYRALRIARNDKTSLPGFEENDYVPQANANARDLSDLLEEFISVRVSTFTLFKSFSEEQLLRIGTASNNPVSVRAIGYITIGHALHHKQIIEERYL